MSWKLYRVRMLEAVAAAYTRGLTASLAQPTHSPNTPCARVWVTSPPARSCSPGHAGSPCECRRAAPGPRGPAGARGRVAHVAPVQPIRAQFCMPASRHVVVPVQVLQSHSRGCGAAQGRPPRRRSPRQPRRARRSFGGLRGPWLRGRSSVRSGVRDHQAVAVPVRRRPGPAGLGRCRSPHTALPPIGNPQPPAPVFQSLRSNPARA